MDKTVMEAAKRDLRQYIGLQIKLRRTEGRMTIADLSKMTGLRPNTISNIERGVVATDLDTLAIIRSALALDIKVVPMGKIIDGVLPLSE